MLSVKVYESVIRRVKDDNDIRSRIFKLFKTLSISLATHIHIYPLVSVRILSFSVIDRSELLELTWNLIFILTGAMPVCSILFPRDSQTAHSCGIKASSTCQVLPPDFFFHPISIKELALKCGKMRKHSAASPSVSDEVSRELISLFNTPPPSLPPPPALSS